MRAPTKAAEQIGGIMTTRGGMPLTRDGEVIGSFTASGGALEDDEHISWVGALALRSL
jgi:uncharacterized protein GlcG (DUF336 family)